MDCPQVTSLKLEFGVLEQKLCERDATIARLRADARAAAKASKRSAAAQDARIASLRQRLEAVPLREQVGLSF